MPLSAIKVICISPSRSKTQSTLSRRYINHAKHLHKDHRCFCSSHEPTPEGPVTVRVRPPPTEASFHSPHIILSIRPTTPPLSLPQKTKKVHFFFGLLPSTLSPSRHLIPAAHLSQWPPHVSFGAVTCPCKHRPANKHGQSRSRRSPPIS